jgi:hypothetical protein
VGRFAERARRHHALVTACSPKGMVCAPSLGTLAGVVTPCSGMPARSPGRNWLTASGASLRPGKLDRLKPYLQQRWEQGCRNAAQLYREIGARGFASPLQMGV